MNESMTPIACKSRCCLNCQSYCPMGFRLRLKFINHINDMAATSTSIYTKLDNAPESIPINMQTAAASLSWLQTFSRMSRVHQKKKIHSSDNPLEARMKTVGDHLPFVEA